MAWPSQDSLFGGAPGPSVSGTRSPYQEDDAQGDADAFARAVIFTICSIGVSAAQARRTYGRCMAALAQGATARMGFRNPTRADAVDAIWRERVRFHRGYRAAVDRVAWLETLPGIGPVMKHRLAVALDLFEANDDPAIQRGGTSETDGSPRPAGSRPTTTEERTGVVTNAF